MNIETKRAKAYLDMLRDTLNGPARNPSPNDLNATNDSPPGLMPASKRPNAPEMPLEPPEKRFWATSPDTNTHMAPRAVAALWARFSHLYGNRFESTYGPALTESGSLQPIASTWAKALSGFGPDDLARGLRACLDRNDGWPPTLPEFRALCTAPKPLAPYHVLAPKACQLIESDDRKAARKAAARVGVEQLRALVGLPRVSR